MGLNLHQYLPLPPGVSYITREQWGLTDVAAQQRGLVPQAMNRTHHFIHHTAGQTPDLSPPIWDDDPFTFIRELDRYARETKKYSALDYSMAVHLGLGYGCTIIEGRAEFVPAATRNSNGISKATVLAGNFHPTGPIHRRNPRQIELDALRWVNTALQIAGYLISGPQLMVLGHRHNPACVGCSSCPGDWLQPHVPYIATRWPVNQPKPPDGPTPKPPAPAPTEVLVENLQYTSIKAVRRHDTRNGNSRPAAGATIEINPMLPAHARTAVVQITTSDARGWGYFTAWDSGPRPDTSVLNTYASGQTIGNMAIVPLDPSGRFRVFTSSGDHVIVDVVGFFA